MNEKWWTFNFFFCFGTLDYSDDIEHETEVTEEEFAFLETLRKYDNGELEEDFDFKEFISEHQNLADNLEERITREIEDNERNITTENDEEDYDETARLCIRWLWK